MVDRTRRVIVQGMLAGSVAGAAVCAGVLIPRAVVAAWSKEAFAAKKVEQALNALFGTSDTTDAAIRIKAPPIAQNGALVGVTVSTDLPDVESITVFASENNNPLSCTINLGKTVKPDISVRIKMAKSADVVAVVKSQGKLYSAKKAVKVTIGGCGG